MPAGDSSAIFNLPEPFIARSLTYYALLDGLNGSQQYFGAILLKLYEQLDAHGPHKSAPLSSAIDVAAKPEEALDAA